MKYYQEIFFSLCVFMVFSFSSECGENARWYFVYITNRIFSMSTIQGGAGPNVICTFLYFNFLSTFILPIIFRRKKKDRCFIHTTKWPPQNRVMTYKIYITQSTPSPPPSHCSLKIEMAQLNLDYNTRQSSVNYTYSIILFVSPFLQSVFFFFKYFGWKPASETQWLTNGSSTWFILKSIESILQSCIFIYVRDVLSLNILVSLNQNELWHLRTAHNNNVYAFNYRFLLNHSPVLNQFMNRMDQSAIYIWPIANLHVISE